LVELYEVKNFQRFLLSYEHKFFFFTLKNYLKTNYAMY